MATKKVNIEELEKQYLEAEKNFKLLREQFEAAKKEEEEAKKAKLAKEKDARYKEVIDAYENFEELRVEFVNDYGEFSFKTENKNGDVFDFFWKNSSWF